MSTSAVTVVGTARRRTRTLERIAIANRGEPAVRLLRAVRELNAARGTSLRTIALYTQPDARALFVREADEAICLGPAVIPGPHGSRISPYVSLERLETALREARADAVWVGWGFASEHPAFVELCERIGIVFVGPSAAAMRLVGDKIEAKRLAESCGVPAGAWSGGPVASLEDARRRAASIGFPLMVKAANGGGGRGIRVVRAAEDLAESFQVARAEALTAFGDGTLFLEKLLPVARHVEVQVVCDGAATAWALGVRDCSLQRRHQKVIEESSSTALDARMEAQLRVWAERLCVQARYRGAATVEFLFDPAAGEATFMEINARLQVEHPVTEATTGADVVKLQLHLAMGGHLDGDPPIGRGHAIEARVCAEDPQNGFAPAPGVVELLRFPGGPGIRIDAGVAEGDTVAAEFDSMIAKIIAWGDDRAEALSRLRRALAEMTVVIRGGATNIAFLRELLAAPEVRAGAIDVGWLDRAQHLAAGRHDQAEVALLLAATEADEEALAIERAQFYTSAVRGRPVVNATIGRRFDLRLHGQHCHMHVDRRGPAQWLVELDGRVVDVDVEKTGRYERRVHCLGATHRAVCVAQPAAFRIDVDGLTHVVSRDDAGLVRAPSPAVVVAVRAAEGDSVEAGAVMAVLEAMKLEMPLTAPFAGTVTRVLVTQNVQVDTGQPIFEMVAALEPAAGDGKNGSARITVPATARAAAGGPNEPVEVLRRLMLGYDVDAAAVQTALSYLDASTTAAELDVLLTFADVTALARRRPDDDAGGLSRSAQDLLFAQLRSLDSPASGPFADTLVRALRHYGVHSLEHTPELEDAFYRIVRAQQHADVQVPAALTLLDRRMDEVAQDRDAGDALRTVLDKVISATRHHHQAVADLARSVRHHRFDEPVMDEARARVYRDVDVHVEALASASADERSRHIVALVECPQPLHNYLSTRFSAAEPAVRGAMLEVMTRRYYRTRAIESFEVVPAHDHLAAVATFAGGQSPQRALSTFTREESIADALRAIRPLFEAMPASDDVVVDIYVWRDTPLPPVAALSRAVRGTLAAAELPANVPRVVMAVTGPGRGTGIAASQHLCFRRGAAGFREETFFRQLHPTMADRLQLWRLRNFTIERLPSVEDVYTFHAVARANPKDERIVAIAEVRDATPIRDAEGRVIALPHLERMLLEALASIRAWQSRRSDSERLQWNRVLLYMWPELRLSAREIYEIVRRLTPDTDGLGLEKIVVRARIADNHGTVKDAALEFSNPTGSGVSMLRFETPTAVPIQPLTAYRQKVVSMRRRGLVYPYEIVRLLTATSDATTSEIPPGDFVEHDLDEHGDLMPVERPPGENTANLVVGVVRNFTWKHPEGMRRVIILGDPSRSLGALAEPECRRIMAALTFAARMELPVEWFTLSSGARISMDSGTENMDWIARVLRSIIDFTQAGGEINLVVNGINVGAQPYWNAEATMLMHTRGILVMTPEGAMVLTGKQALDYSGGVSAEDNLGIGGYERVMGPNGQAQYWAADLSSACAILLRHYEHSYRVPGERFPRRAATEDPPDRDIGLSPHPRSTGSNFTRVADIFTDERNPGRKKPFDMRAVMRAVIDHDHEPLERWTGMLNADIAIVWDAHLGGYPVCLLGFESRPLKRAGFIPADGPDHWTPGTLFPQSSRKIARAINAASDNRPLVVLANLSGFDGSPESMRRLQLEFGAEIGRAVVNFRGPMVFCVVSRYHGGAFVVFSAALNRDMEVAAVEGSYASVIGGAPAAAVVFSREVEARTKSDPRVAELGRAIDAADGSARLALRARMGTLLDTVRGEKLGEVAAAFDAVHTVQRAQRVGSVHHIIRASRIRPYLIEAVERGIERELQRSGLPR